MVAYSYRMNRLNAYFIEFNQLIKIFLFSFLSFFISIQRNQEYTILCVKYRYRGHNHTAFYHRETIVGVFFLLCIRRGRIQYDTKNTNRKQHNDVATKELTNTSLHSVNR